MPTPLPTLVPTSVPTLLPTIAPSFVPTSAPTKVPSLNPTSSPTFIPNPLPTIFPTPKPTFAAPCSAKTCEELKTDAGLGSDDPWAWEESGETLGGTVCAERDAAPLGGCLEDVTAPHWEGSTHAESQKYCHNISARLCTYDEMYAGDSSKSTLNLLQTFFELTADAWPLCSARHKTYTQN